MTLLKIHELKDRLRISLTTAYNLVARGKIRHVRVGLGRGGIRIPEEALMEYLKAREWGGQSEPLAPPQRAKLKHLA
jgi:excisionase family DNA binding protein